jgi:nicotinamidase-related amidase
MTSKPMRLRAAESLLLIVDVQEKLLKAMPDAPGLIRDICFLTKVANALGVPIRVTEQYPKGLGPTTAEIRELVPGPYAEKVRFSCAGAQGAWGELIASGKTIVVVGMEAHVCVLQTVLDLREHGIDVAVPVDAVQSRDPLDHQVALSRFERCGTLLTTVETVAFEWLGGADEPQFKLVSQLVQERMKSRRPGL